MIHLAISRASPFGPGRAFWCAGVYAELGDCLRVLRKKNKKMGLDLRPFRARSRAVADCREQILRRRMMHFVSRKFVYLCGVNKMLQPRRARCWACGRVRLPDANSSFFTGSLFRLGRRSCSPDSCVDALLSNHKARYLSNLTSKKRSQLLLLPAPIGHVRVLREAGLSHLGRQQHHEGVPQTGGGVGRSEGCRRGNGVCGILPFQRQPGMRVRVQVRGCRCMR